MKINKAIAAFSEGAVRSERAHRTTRKLRGFSTLPHEVQEIVQHGMYTDSFLSAFDGQVFQLHGEQVAPYHEYCLALEVHAGGKYWANMCVEESDVRHNVHVVTSDQSGGIENTTKGTGSAQRGAMLVWRWKYVPERGPYDLPVWLSSALHLEGNDPLVKLQAELESLSRWEQLQQEDTLNHVRKAPELHDRYIRELLRLWPSEPGSHGDTLKKTAWIQGLKEEAFVGKTVLIAEVAYGDESDGHMFALHVVISKKHSEDFWGDTKNPHYRLKTMWRWKEMSLPLDFVRENCSAEPALVRPKTQSEEVPPKTRSLTGQCWRRRQTEDAER